MKNKNWLKLLIYSISIVLTVIYILYRTFFTIPTKLGILSLILAIIVLIIEIWEAIDFFIYFLNILIVNKKQISTPKIDFTNIPDIDIFIATFNESKNILERTIEACINLDYPDKSKLHIYICDDGNRKEIELLANSLNVNYISRINNKNAKAGNYNNALSKTNSPYIATFDADMAPTKDFLMSTLPFFTNCKKDEKVGFVQLPQSFINSDIFQYRFRLENIIPFEQEYFYHNIQIAKNETNSCVCCGTNTLFSRDALNDVNGFATQTLTEDIATGMLIESKGYKCIALNKIGAYGISVHNFDGFIKQRSRWARGCIQMYKKYKVFKNNGLSIRQKLEYLSCVSYWFFGLRRLIYLIAPLLFSIFGIIIVDCNLATFVSIWLPTYLIKRFALDILQNKERSSTWNKIYETILAPVLCIEVIKETLGFKKTQFEVSPKSNSDTLMSFKNKKLLLVHLTFLLLNITGFAMCIARIYDQVIYNYILSFVWTLSNIFYLSFAVLFDIRYKKPKKDNTFYPNKIKRYNLLKTLTLSVFSK